MELLGLYGAHVHRALQGPHIPWKKNKIKYQIGDYHPTKIHACVVIKGLCTHKAVGN
jgi:hypothetical protein